MHRLKHLLDKWNRKLDIFWCFLSLRLVFGEGVMAKSLSMIECYTNMRWLFLCKNLVQGVAKAHNSRCIQALRVDTWTFDKCVV